MTNSLSLEQLKRALSLKEQIAALEAELNAILGEDVSTPATPAAVSPMPRDRGRLPGKREDVAPAPLSSPTVPVQRGRGGARNMSPEARAKIAAAQKARWAKYHEAKGGAKPKTKTGGMSREERGRLGATARWAKIRKPKGIKG